MRVVTHINAQIHHGFCHAGKCLADIGLKAMAAIGTLGNGHLCGVEMAAHVNDKIICILCVLGHELRLGWILVALAEVNHKLVEGFPAVLNAQLCLQLCAAKQQRTGCQHGMAAHKSALLQKNCVLAILFAIYSSTQASKTAANHNYISLVRIVFIRVNRDFLRLQRIYIGAALLDAGFHRTNEAIGRHGGGGYSVQIKRLIFKNPLAQDSDCFRADHHRFMVFRSVDGQNFSVGKGHGNRILSAHAISSCRVRSCLKNRC